MSNHAHLITPTKGVWLLRPEVFINILQGPEARPEGRSQTTPTTTPSCASRTPFLNQVLAGHRKSTASPQKPHSFHKAKMHTSPSRLFHHTAHTRAHLISCVGGATPPPHNHTHFTPSLPFLQPYSPHNHTGVVCLINCHSLTFDLLTHPPRHLAKVRGHTGWGTCPPYLDLSSHPGCGPHNLSEAWAHNAMPHPTGNNKTCIKAHTCTHAARMTWDTPTS